MRKSGCLVWSRGEGRMREREEARKFSPGERKETKPKAGGELKKSTEADFFSAEIFTILFIVLLPVFLVLKHE